MAPEAPTDGAGLNQKEARHPDTADAAYMADIRSQPRRRSVGGPRLFRE